MPAFKSKPIGYKDDAHCGGTQFDVDLDSGVQHHGHGGLILCVQKGATIAQQDIAEFLEFSEHTDLQRLMIAMGTLCQDSITSYSDSVTKEFTPKGIPTVTFYYSDDKGEDLHGYADIEQNSIFINCRTLLSIKNNHSLRLKKYRHTLMHELAHCYTHSERESHSANFNFVYAELMGHVGIKEHLVNM
jgi:hypothetical protein